MSHPGTRIDWGLELGISAAGFTARAITNEPDILHRIRRFTRKVMDEWNLPQHADAVIAVVAELAANAVMHSLTTGSTTAWLGLLRKDEAVICAVSDPSPHPPTIPPPLTYANLLKPHGRGMIIIDGLSSAWGYSEPTPQGKTVWAKIPAPSQPAMTPRLREREH
ncbi:ATP-binding protein [Streptomyces sp. NPDC048349]|uniref:ATP-binding protein n=1 Tax=Streptomyces sp. NPDC048349 TaxID=3155486 RepID=UPI0034449C45